MHRGRGGSLVETLIVIALAIAVIAWLIPPWLAERRVETERKAVRSFFAIRDAEECLRSNDLDGNRNFDYWTRDIRGLRKFNLIDERLAAADGAHPNRRGWQSHYYQMVERDPDGKPLAGADGCGERLIYTMSPASREFHAVWAWDTDHPKLYCRRDLLSPPHQWPLAPAADGWGIAD